MLAVVAQIKVKPGSESQFEELAKQMAEASRQEEGCLEYGLWRMEETGQYAFVERYKDAAAVEAHRKSDHFRQIGRAMGAFMDGAPSIIRLTKI